MLRAVNSTLTALFCLVPLGALAAPNADEGHKGHLHAGQQTLKVIINSVSEKGVGDSIGEIVFTDSERGLLIAPRLKGLSAGEHGFHIHQNPDCSPALKDGVMVAAQAAGGHYDPHATGAHKGPHGGGHQGDLPKLVVSQDGTTSGELVVSGLRLADIMNRSVMIHAGGDNYSDQPAALGGGGARIACGVLKAGA